MSERSLWISVVILSQTPTLPLILCVLLGKWFNPQTSVSSKLQWGTLLPSSENLCLIHSRYIETNRSHTRDAICSNDNICLLKIDIWIKWDNVPNGPSTGWFIDAWYILAPFPLEWLQFKWWCSSSVKHHIIQGVRGRWVDKNYYYLNFIDKQLKVQVTYSVFLVKWGQIQSLNLNLSLSPVSCFPFKT